MKRTLSLVLSMVMVLSILASMPIVANADYVNFGTVCTYNSGETFTIKADYDGWYYVESVDNEGDPFLQVFDGNGNETTYDDANDETYEFEYADYLYAGDTVSFEVGNWESSQINVLVTPAYDVEVGCSYTVASGSKFCLETDHACEYFIYSEGENDPELILTFPDGSEVTYDDADVENGVYDFEACFDAGEIEHISGYVYDYDDEYADINFTVTCACNYDDNDEFEPGYYYTVPACSEFVFTAQEEGYYNFFSFDNDGLDPYILFEDSFEEEGYVKFDDADFDADCFEFDATIYLYEGDEIAFGIGEFDESEDVDITFGIQFFTDDDYDCACEDDEDCCSWYETTAPTYVSRGEEFLVCDYCRSVIDFRDIPMLKPATPKATTTNEIGGVQVKWNAVAGATKYVVYRRQGGYKTWVNVGTTTGTTLLDKNVKSGIYYVYSVRAYNSDGQYSDFVTANTQTRKYMATPKLTTIYNHQNGLAIKWNAVAGVTNGYRVYRRGAGSTYWTYLGTTKNLYFIDSQVKNRNGEYFRYTVIADGGYHSKFDTTGLYLRRLANPTLNSAVSSKSGITVKWGAVKGTTGYYVYRKTANSTWVRVAAVGGTNNTTFLDKTAKKGTTYTYTVRAVYGNTLSSYYSGISCKDKY